MLQAFDTLLQTAVSAKAAAANSDNEAFRYECLCCGEEVFLAAQDSVYKAAHFRHRGGNNDKNCELYLGQYGIVPTVSLQRSKKQDRVEFYYKNTHKAFFVSFRFSEAEITAYESSGVRLEMRSSRTLNPFLVQGINHTNFHDDSPEEYMLEIYASPYYISNTLNNIKREYSLFGTTGPTFFKIQGEDTAFTAKFIKSKSLYTNVKYSNLPLKTLLTTYMSRILFRGKPIICNKICADTFTRCLSNTIVNNEPVNHIVFSSDLDEKRICAALNMSGRIVVLENFLGNYNETLLLSILDKFKSKITILSVTYEKTLFYLPNDFLAYCHYVNLSRLSGFTRATIPDEDPSILTENEITQVDFPAKNKYQDIVRSIALELGFSRLVSDKITEFVSDDKSACAVLSLSIIPYLSDVMGKNAFAFCGISCFKRWQHSVSC